MRLLTSENVLYILSNMFRIYVFYRFSNVFYKSKHKIWYLEFIAYTAFFVVNSAIYFLINVPIINLLSNILPMLAITFLYRRKAIYNIGITFSICLINLLCDCFVSPFINDSPVVRTGMVTSLLFFVVSLLFELFYKRREFKMIRGQKLVAIMFMPIGSIVIAILTMNSFRKEIVAEAAILFLFNVIVFYLFGSLDQAHEELHEQALAAQQAKAYMNQLEIVYQSQEQIRYLRHDMKNHLQEMKILLDQNRISELKKYICVSESALINPREYIHTGNGDIDSLMNYKLQIAKEMDAEVEANVSIPDGLPIDSFDIVSILGNLMDNAIEALRTAESKIIKISIQYDKKILFISIQNTCAQPPAFENERPIRLIRNGNTARGIGLKSVDHTLKKYHGNMKFSYVDYIFTVTAMLYL